MHVGWCSIENSSKGQQPHWSSFYKRMWEACRPLSGQNNRTAGHVKLLLLCCCCYVKTMCSHFPLFPFSVPVVVWPVKSCTYAMSWNKQRQCTFGNGAPNLVLSHQNIRFLWLWRCCPEQLHFPCLQKLKITLLATVCSFIYIALLAPHFLCKSLILFIDIILLETNGNFCFSEFYLKSFNESDIYIEIFYFLPEIASTTIGIFTDKVDAEVMHMKDIFIHICGDCIFLDHGFLFFCCLFSFTSGIFFFVQACKCTTQNHVL